MWVSKRFLSFFDYLTLAFHFSLMCYLIWNKQAHILIDFGHQSYYPLQLNEGESPLLRAVFRSHPYLLAEIFRYLPLTVTDSFTRRR